MIHIITTKNGKRYRLADNPGISARQEAILIGDHLSGVNPHPIWTVTCREIISHEDHGEMGLASGTDEIFYSQIASVHRRDAGSIDL